MTEMQTKNTSQYREKGGDTWYCEDNKKKTEKIDNGATRDNWVWDVERIGIQKTSVEIYTLRWKE